MKMLLACGGTGGHLFPGIALAETFEERVPGVEIVFVGTPRGLEKDVLPKTHWRLEMIASQSLADKKGIKKIEAGFGLFKTLKASCHLIKKEKPDLVIGIGGYAAGPILMMASLLRKPTLTVEPNAIPGMTTRLLKPFVDRVVVAYPQLEEKFGAKKARFFGVPVRKSIIKGAKMATFMGKKVVFIFGGSQGAKTINEGILEALPFLKALNDRIYFIHQIGKQTPVHLVEKAYLENGFQAEVYPFVEKMGPIYGRADLVIARAGANTLAELVALAKPSLLIPYPHAAGGHQEWNARSLEKEGGTKVLLDSEATGEKLAMEIRALLESPGMLKRMERSLEKLGGNQAADKIVEECLRLIKHV